jgi:archaemetzincin
VTGSPAAAKPAATTTRLGRELAPGGAVGARMRLAIWAVVCVLGCAKQETRLDGPRTGTLHTATASGAPVDVTGPAGPAPQVTALATQTAQAPARPTEGELNARAFSPAGDLFLRKQPSKDGDWLTRFREPGQSFEQYVARKPVRPDGRRNKLVLQPLGEMSAADREMIETARDYMTVFFALPVVIAAPLKLPEEGRRIRRDGGKVWRQSHTRVLLEQVLSRRLPDDAIAYLGVTLEDLYPEPSWNFVFGQATLEDRVGVYSLARFFAAFDGEPDTAASRALGVRRSLAVLAHEAGHMFSMEHCTSHECVMNGSNSREELDRQREMLCPVCLRKLQHALGDRFDVLTREEALLAFHRKHGQHELAHWTERRVEQLRTAVIPPEKPELRYPRP